jgi:hypothetical protein
VFADMSQRRLVHTAAREQGRSSIQQCPLGL